MTVHDGWTRCPLGEAGTWLSGGTPQTSESAFWGGEIPWISAASLTNFYVQDSPRRVTELGAASGTRIVGPGTILCVVRGMSLKTVFRVGIARRRVAFGQDCKALVPRPGIDPLFLANVMRARQVDILNMVDEAGHGTGRLQSDRLYALEVQLPPTNEQRVIAQVLGALDDKIDANARLATLCERMAVSHLQRVHGERTVASFATVGRNQLKREQFTNEVVEYYSLPAFDVRRLPARRPGQTIRSSKFCLTRPSVLVSKLNPHVARVWYSVPTPGVLALASTEFVVLEPKGGWTATLLWAACATPPYVATLAKNVTGTTGSHQRVNSHDVLSTTITDLAAVPQHVRNLIDGLVRRSLACRRESERLTRLRDTLLPPLISGRLRLRDVEALSERQPP